MYEKLSTQAHVENAKNVIELEKRLGELYFLLADNYGTSHKLSKRMLTVWASFKAIKVLLDDEYEKVATDEELLQYGRVYHGLSIKPFNGGDAE